MTPRERFLSALGLGDVDQIPVFYQHLGGASWVLSASGTTMREGFRDEKAFARICRSAYDTFRFDNVMAGWGDLLVEAHAHGTEWKFPERDFYPRVARFAVTEPSDVERLRAVDPLEDEHWSVQLRATALLRQHPGNEAAVVGGIISPFFLTAQLRGFENLLMDAFNDEGLVTSMLEVSLESTRMYADRAAEAGADAVFIDDSTATGQLMSPEMAERYDIASLRPLLSRIGENGLGTIVHNDAMMPYLELQASASPRCLHFCVDYVDLPATMDLLGGRMCIMPGIDHQQLLFRRTPDEVEKAVRSVIDRYGDRPGIIMAPGCEMPFKTPMENIVRLRETCHRNR
jgi:uroporphyrinogen decarboxylase